MIQLLFPWTLLAQESRIGGMSQGFKDRRVDSGDAVTMVLIIASVTLAVVLLTLLLRSQERRHRHSSRLGLFLELCKAHGLPWKQRWLLWCLARAHRLKDPARLFLEPARFRSRKLPAWLLRRSVVLKQIHDRVFADLEELEVAAREAPPSGDDAAVSQRQRTPLPPKTPTPTLDVAPPVTVDPSLTELPTAGSR